MQSNESRIHLHTCTLKLDWRTLCQCPCRSVLVDWSAWMNSFNTTHIMLTLALKKKQEMLRTSRPWTQENKRVDSSTTDRFAIKTPTLNPEYDSNENDVWMSTSIVLVSNRVLSKWHSEDLQARLRSKPPPQVSFEESRSDNLTQLSDYPLAPTHPNPNWCTHTNPCTHAGIYWSRTSLYGILWWSSPHFAHCLWSDWPRPKVVVSAFLTFPLLLQHDATAALEHHLSHKRHCTTSSYHHFFFLLTQETGQSAFEEQVGVINWPMHYFPQQAFTRALIGQNQFLYSSLTEGCAIRQSRVRLQRWALPVTGRAQLPYRNRWYV